jgi:hypothetical protein
MDRRFGLKKSVTPWHAYVIVSAAYVTAQHPIHNPDVHVALGFGYMTAALVGFYLVVRVAMAVMTVVEELTSLWPNRLLSVQVYCLGFATAEILLAVQAHMLTDNDAFTWSSEPATGAAIFGLVVVGIPLTAGYALANWVWLNFLPSVRPWTDD